MAPLNLPAPCVVVLVGPGAAGKSTWAAAHFPADWIVSSDRLRATVGAGEDDITASADAFAVLETVVALRLARRLTTVIDTLGLDVERRRGWLESARAAGMPCVVVAFDTSAAQCRERNRGRLKRIPADVLAQQLKSWSQTRALLPDEGFDLVLEPEPVRVVPEGFRAAPEAVRRQLERPTGLRFGLHIGTFGFGPEKLAEIAAGAEAAGFDAIYVMDHFRQIPQVGRAWDDFLESYTTLAWLAAHTERVRVGALVTGITYRNVAHLGKIVATLDILSGGRAVCGLGLAWFEAEHRAYGWEFPSVGERYELLEDALQLLPLLWGPGSPSFAGKAISVPEAVCYPRPVQSHIPVILGGGGSRTMRLAARYADVANVFGDAGTVAEKAAQLRRYAAEAGRTVELSHLSTVLIGSDDEQVRGLVDQLRPRRQDPARFAAAVNAGTVADHVGRCRELAEAGVSEIVVRLADLVDAAPLERMAQVIAAFR